MFKHFIISLSIFLISCQPINLTAQDVTNLEKEVLLSFQKLVSASKDRDLEIYFSLIDQQKFTGLKADGSNWNSFDDLKSDVTSGFSLIDSVKELKFPNIKVTIIDSNTAILVNEYLQVVELKDGIQLSMKGGGTQVWSKSSGNWLLVSISASLSP